MDPASLVDNVQDSLSRVWALDACVRWTSYLLDEILETGKLKCLDLFYRLPISIDLHFGLFGVPRNAIEVTEIQRRLLHLTRQANRLRDVDRSLVFAWRDFANLVSLLLKNELETEEHVIPKVSCLDYCLSI